MELRNLTIYFLKKCIYRIEPQSTTRNCVCFLFWQSCQIFLTLKDFSRTYGRYKIGGRRGEDKKKDDAIKNHIFLKGKYSALIWNIAGSQTTLHIFFSSSNKHHNCHMAGTRQASNMKENVLAEVIA